MVEQQLPIDIHSSKLLDWLISRRHCKKDWQSNALAIREKIKHAILDMPEDERIVKLLQGAYINYFHCSQIVDILKETEKDTKNFFGFYSSQRMNDWLLIKNLYEKNNVYLAEAAQILQRLVQYDIPALKKQITKCDSTVAECSRKEDDYTKQAASSKKQYERELENLGVEGKHLRREIQMLAADLPAFFASVSEKISELIEPLEYYRNFRKYLHQGEMAHSVLLPVCSLLMSQGPDTTAFEWKHGKKPSSVERPAHFVDALNEEKVDESSSKNDDEIDFGDDADIDFGEGDAINFENISISCTLSGDATSGTEFIDATNDEIARGEEALTLLENAETRGLIVNELNELLAFLLFRLEDESAENSADIYISGFESRSSDIANITVKDIEAWKSQVTAVQSELTDTNKLQLFRIYSFPGYVSTLLETLEHKRSLEDRYLQMRSLAVEKRAEAIASAGKAQSELNQIIEATKVLQRQIEGEISRRYQGTPVNIMGGIVAALKAT